MLSKPIDKLAQDQFTSRPKWFTINMSTKEKPTMTTTLLPAPTRPISPARAKRGRSRDVTIEKVATPLTVPHMVRVLNPITQREVKHFGYEARVQHKSKQDEVRTILCSRLDTVRVGEPVMLTYHHGMKAYKHSRYVSVSDSNNCAGGFYYVNGVKA